MEAYVTSARFLCTSRCRKMVSDQGIQSSLCVLFLVSSIITKAFPACIWKGQITTMSAPYSECSFFSNTDGETKVNDIIEELQVFHLMSPSSEIISAFRYYILAQVDCDNEDASSIARALYSQGGVAVVTITVPSQSMKGRHLTWKELSFEGALVELNDSCSSSVCDPAWVVPVPVSEEHHLMYIDISTEGGHYTVQSSEFTVYPDGYWRAFSPEESPLYGVGREVSEDHVQQRLGFLEPATAHFLPPLTSPSFLTINGRLTISTSNSFQDNVFVEFTRVSLTRVCEGMESFAITLADRVLYGDHQAAFEIFGHFASSAPRDNEFQPITIVNSCIWRIVIPPHSHLVEWSVYAITGEGRDEIHHAALESSQPLVFYRVLDGGGAGPCGFIMDTMEGSTGCSVLSGAASATTPQEVFFLVQTEKDGDALYVILLLTGNIEAREWRYLARVPASNCTAVDPDLCFVDPSVVLTDITTTARPSKHLFVWGSIVLHSPDEGITWYHLADYSSSAMVTLLATSSDGQLVILNEDQEIWYGSCVVTVSLVLLRPSDGWELREFIEPPDKTRNTTLSLFFDYKNSLREVFTFPGDSGLQSITSRVIPAAGIVQLTKHSRIIGRDSTPNLDQHLCPFARLRLVVEISHSADRREYYEFSPPRLTNGVLHDQDSLIVYQGLLHLILSLREQGGRTNYTGDLYNPMEQWLAAHQPLESYHEYLYRNRLLHQGLGVYVPLAPFTNQGIQDLLSHSQPMSFWAFLDHSPQLLSTINLEQFLNQPHHFKVRNGTIFTLPAEIFLDKNGTYSFRIQLMGWPQSGEDGFDGFHGLEQLLLMADVSHQDLLQISLTRHVDYLRDTVEYLVTLRDSSSITHQATPGELLLTSSVSIEAWQSAMKCFDQRDEEPSAQGLVTMSVIHGCPPGRVLQYDINGTILYHGADEVYDCPQVDPKLPCSYFSHDFHPQFEIMDLTTGRTEPFTGPYTLKMIGGRGPEEDHMRHYTSHEIAQYNWQDRHSLIWHPVDAEYDGEVVVFDREHNGIIWRCQQYSPCGERPLNFPYSPEYIFLVEVTNKGVRSVDTYCDYTVQFLVKVHGLPISSQMSIMIVVWCLVLSFSVITLFLVCDWNDKRIWRRFKRRVQRGLRVHPKLGSTEWGIQTSSSGSGASSAPSFEETLVTRRRFDRVPRRSEGEVTWNLEDSWVPPGLDEALEEVPEGEDETAECVDEAIEEVPEGEDETAECVESVDKTVGTASGEEVNTRKKLTEVEVGGTARLEGNEGVGENGETAREEGDDRSKEKLSMIKEEDAGNSSREKVADTEKPVIEGHSTEELEETSTDSSGESAATKIDTITGTSKERVAEKKEELIGAHSTVELTEAKKGGKGNLAEIKGTDGKEELMGARDSKEELVGAVEEGGSSV